MAPNFQGKGFPYIPAPGTFCCALLLWDSAHLSERSHLERAHEKCVVCTFLHRRAFLLVKSAVGGFSLPLWIV